MKTDERLEQAKSLSVGGTAADDRASLCIYAADIDIEAISKLLGCEPTESHKRGEVRLRKTPVRTRRRPVPYEIGLWQLKAPSDLSFKAKLDYLIKTTTSKRGSWDSLASGHDIQLRCVVFLHSWNEGFDLPSELVAEIGRRHWQFALSMYSAEGEEILDAFLKPRKDGREPSAG